MDEFEDALGRAVGRGGQDMDVEGAASVLAAAGDTWETAAERAAGRFLRECRARGWGEADLVRMAARELTPRHRRLAAGLAAGATVGDFAKAERLDRFSAATEFVEVLCLYARLPRITALTPPARGAPPHPAGGALAPSKMLGRIRALLAKAESTAFPEEAEALSAKAQHLMARHSIDEALLSSAETAPGPGARRIGVDRPYEGAKALLLDAVAAANRCQAVWSGDFGFSTVVGHAPDLDAVELLYTSLLVQADRALHRGASRSRDFRESFLIAYAGRIRDRLSAATRAEEAAATEAAADTSTAGPDLLPALAARDLAVRTATRRLFPTTTTSRLKGRDADGWTHGEEAANRARLPPAAPGPKPPADPAASG